MTLRNAWPSTGNCRGHGRTAHGNCRGLLRVAREHHENTTRRTGRSLLGKDFRTLSPAGRIPARERLYNVLNNGITGGTLTSDPKQDLYALRDPVRIGKHRFQQHGMIRHRHILDRE